MGLYSNFSAGIDPSAIAGVMRKTESSWLNGIIQIVDPNVGDGVFDPWANQEVGGDPSILWQGSARIQPLRSSQGNAGVFDQSEIRGVRFKIPLDAKLEEGVIREGLQVYVVDGGEDENLEYYVYVIANAFNSSFAWNRTIEAKVDTAVMLDTPYNPLTLIGPQLLPSPTTLPN